MSCEEVNQYIEDLEKRIETLEGLLSEECVTASLILNKARIRVHNIMCHRKDVSRNFSVTVQDNGIRIGFLFGSEEDYSITIPWKQCDTDTEISKYLDRISKRIDSSETDEDGFLVRDF